MISILYTLWILHLLLFNGTYSFSACDEIDVTFVIDTDSIISNSEGIIKLITSVIWSGSSEHTGFSVVIYGHNIPIHQRIKIISLHDTQSATQRQDAEKKVDDKLKKAFDNIKSVAPHKTTTYQAKQYITNVLQSSSTDDNNDDSAPQPDKPDKPDKSNKPDHGKRRDSDKNTVESADSDPHNPVKQWKGGGRPKPDDLSESTAPKSAQSKHKKSTEKEKHSSADRDGAYPEGNLPKTKSIGLVPAFKIATGQSRPPHGGDRKLKLGYDPQDKSIIGDHDNQQVYIIFDHDNKVLHGGGTDVDICALFHHLDHNAITNDDEAPYFMLGQDYGKGETQAIFCEGKIPSYIDKNTFFRFSLNFAYNKDKMEHVYALTCPAEIKSPQYHGKINVGNHVQYIDLKTVIACSLYYYDDDNDRTTPEQLDESKSFIKVKDFIHDDNTFQLDDYLISTPGAVPALRKLNCKAAVMRIAKIVHVDETAYGTSDSNEANDYKILKLYVKLPGSPMEYMQDANVHGRVKVHKYKKTGSRRGSATPRKHKYNEYDDYGPSSAKQLQQDELDDEVFYNEKQILAGEMDHVLKDNPFAQNVANNILKRRKQKMNNVAVKLARMRKIRNTLIKTFPHKKRYISSKIFASRLMESNLAMNPFGISLKDLLLGRIKVEGDIKLVNIDFRNDWTMKKVGEEVEMSGDPLPSNPKCKMELSASGDGDLVLRFGYIFRFIVGVKFKFFWQIYTPIIDITFVTYIEWDVGAFFYVKCKGEAQFNIDNIFHWEKDIRFSIGPVPVLLTPYVTIFAVIASVPRPVYTGISCRYNERMELGFRFCTIPGCKPGPIKRKITKHKGCKKKLGLDHREQQDRDYGHNLQCPRGDRVMGFDIKLNVKIGVILYSIVNIFLRMEFVIPFRVMYPTFKSKDCYLPKGMDMCKITKKTQYLKAHFWFSMHLNIYMGVFVDFGNLIGMVLGIFGVPLPAAAAPDFEFKILGPIPIIPKISLGCLDLKGHLLEIDTSLRHACCVGKLEHYPPIKSPNKYYDENYMDNYHHQYSYGDQNPYYDQPFYEDQQYNKKNHFNIHDPYHYNDENEFNPYYYSPAYHIPVGLRPMMDKWKKYHETKDNSKRKYKINEKHFKRKYPLPFDVPD